LDQGLIQDLINKSGTDADLINRIFKYIGFVQTGKKITDQELIQLNYLTEQFYKQSRL